MTNGMGPARYTSCAMLLKVQSPFACLWLLGLHVPRRDIVISNLFKFRLVRGNSLLFFLL